MLKPLPRFGQGLFLNPKIMNKLKNAEIQTAKILNQDFISHSINFTIKRYYTDVNGVIQTKASVPAVLQTKYPFFLFGEFDRQGGYKQGLSAVPPMAGTYYVCTGVNGMGWSTFSVLGFGGINDLQGKLLVGDIVHVYTDSLSAPTYFIWVVQSAAVASLASILANSKTTQKDDKFNRLYIEEINFSALPNTDFIQFKEPITEIRLNNIGLAKTDSINVLGTYETPYTYLRNIIIMPIKFKVDQFIELGSYFVYDSDSIQYLFKMLK
jgi:hypothetical protein